MYTIYSLLTGGVYLETLYGLLNVFSPFYIINIAWSVIIGSTVCVEFSLQCVVQWTVSCDGFSVQCCEVCNVKYSLCTLSIVCSTLEYEIISVLCNVGTPISTNIVRYRTI